MYGTEELLHDVTGRISRLVDSSVGDPVLRAEIGEFLEKGGLGQGTPLHRLFEFLADWSLARKPVAEIDIAIEVFHKSGTDPGDASVRVYIHRLRRKIEAYYEKLGAASENRLVIPRGEYRLALARNIPEVVEPLLKKGPSRRALFIGAGSAGAVVTAAGIGAGVALNGPWVRDTYRDVRRSPFWSALVERPRPILLVLGDYYIFGESDTPGSIDRMVREFDVNSRLDLDQFLMEHPDKVGRYVDLNLTYLPLGAALALTNLMPFLKEISQRGMLRTITASELAPEMLKSNHVVYVGYLSGLGRLENTVFSKSRFAVGETYPVGTKIYDQILDRETRRVYASQAGRPAENKVHHDYGYISIFDGPNGNRIVVLSGTRDVGVMQSADVATNPEALDGLSRSVRGAKSLEAVYEVEGLARMNLMGQLVISAARANLSAD